MINLTQQELDTLFLQSFRYCLGRTSYAVQDFCNMLLNHKNLLSDGVLKRLHKELQDAFVRDNCDREHRFEVKTLGHDCDRHSWSLVLKELTNV